MTLSANPNFETVAPTESDTALDRASIQMLASHTQDNLSLGTRRRVLTQDVIDYKNRIDTARMQNLAELAAQAQELNMGYN